MWVVKGWCRQAAWLLASCLGATGCSCGDATLDQGPEVGGRLCFEDPETRACEADRGTLDWGTVTAPEGNVVVLERRLSNRGAGALVLTDARAVEEVGGERRYAVQVCRGDCGVAGPVSFPVTLAPEQVVTVRITLDIGGVDGPVPTGALEISSDDTGDELAPSGLYRRPFGGAIATCRDGFVDANDDLTDGCECALSAQTDEACDGVDNDCDGTIDEDVPGTGIPCDTGLPGECQDGATTCTGGVFSCTSLLASVPETCDGEDNDCDGQVDEDNTWAPFNNGLSGANVTEVAHDPRTADTAYMLAGDRLYQSLDGGATFTLVSSEGSSFNQLAFPPGAADVLLAATSGGLQRSEDGGRTWSLLSLGGTFLQRILVHPADANIVFVGTEGGGILRSTSGGAGFTAVNNGVPFGRVTDLVGDPADAGRVVASLIAFGAQGGFADGQVLVTSNGGASWTSTLAGIDPVYAIASCATNADVVYAASFGDGVYRSLDGGDSWAPMPTSGPNASDVAVAPGDCDVAYASLHPFGIDRTTDGGASFTGPLATGIDSELPRLMRLSVDPGDPSRVLAGNHSGVFSTSDAAATWSRVTGVEAVLARGLAVGADGSTIYMSTWGQGLWSRGPGFTPWMLNAAVDRDYGFTVATVPGDSSRLFMAGWPDFLVSEDGGAAFFLPSDRPANVFDVTVDPGDDQVVYAASQLSGVWKSLDGGSTWAAANGGLPAAWQTPACTCQDTRAVLVDANDSNIVYLGTNLFGLYRSVDAGVTWSAVAPELAGETVHCLIQKDSDIYACVEGNGIWKSGDSGASFARVAGELQELTDTWQLFLDPIGILLAATDEGVFSSADGEQWMDMDNQCLPSFGARDVVTIEDNGARRIVVGTYGAGMFTLPL